MFEIEPIPNEDFLFMRVHEMFLDEDGEPMPTAFRNQPDGAVGMSVDWDKYAKPLDTKNRARKPDKNAIIRFMVGHARLIPNQTVEHKPVDSPIPNQSHSEVIGDKTIDVEVRARFMDIYELVIPIESK